MVPTSFSFCFCLVLKMQIVGRYQWLSLLGNTEARFPRKPLWTMLLDRFCFVFCFEFCFKFLLAILSLFWKLVYLFISLSLLCSNLASFGKFEQFLSNLFSVFYGRLHHTRRSERWYLHIRYQNLLQEKSSGGNSGSLWLRNFEAPFGSTIWTIIQTFSIVFSLTKIWIFCSTYDPNGP